LKRWKKREVQGAVLLLRERLVAGFSRQQQITGHLMFVLIDYLLANDQGNMWGFRVLIR
jgi:hypothetical protein